MCALHTRACNLFWGATFGVPTDTFTALAPHDNNSSAAIYQARTRSHAHVQWDDRAKRNATHGECET